jgi:hypothetical protein
MDQSPKPKLRPKLRLSYDDLKKIERVVNEEAKGEGVKGRNAIRGVIFNRLMSERFPNSVDEVLSPKEFEPVGKYGSIDKIPVDENTLNERLTEMADYIQYGEDASKGSTFFLNKKLAKKRKTDFGGKGGMTIGNHTFYKSYQGQEPVEDVNFSHNVEVYYEGYDAGGFVSKFMDMVTSPLTGDSRKEKPLSVNAADTAVSLATPIDSMVEIQAELEKDEPDYLKIGMLGGMEAIGLLAPGAGKAAQSMIRKGADMARQTDEAIEVTRNVPKVTKTKPEEFSGSLPTQHGFTGDRPTEFLPRGEYKGQRYDSTGGVFGDKPLYLEDPENPFFLTDDGVVSFSYDDVTDVDASFNKAFVLTPETVSILKSKVGDVDLLDEASGPLVVDKLEELGYDGLIIRGFPNPETTDLGRLRAEQSDKLRSLSKEDFEKGYNIVEDYKPRIQAARELEGIDDTLQQSQVLAFRPERQKVLDPAGNPQLDNEAYAAKMNAFDVEDDIVKWKENVKEEISKSRDVDPVVRTYPLETAAQQFLDKKITREEYLKYIDEHKPVTGWDQLPREPSTKAMVYSLKPNQISGGSFVVSPEDAAKLDVKQSSLSVGDFFDGRLDVTAYKEFDTWIVAGAKTGEKGQHYAKAVHYQGGNGKPVTLLNSDNPKKYETNIRTGERIGAAQKNPKGQTYGKTPYAAISGYVKDLDVDNIRNLAEQLLNDPEWVQLGFDPRRQGNFYVRREKSNAPLHAVATSAEEVIQIGPLVLAKNPVLDLDYEGFSEGGMAMDEQMGMMFKSSRGMAMNEGGDIGETVGVDPVSGNEIPLGSTAENVRDDIPAQLSEGEYVVPADVVRYYGVKFFEDLRTEAKVGFQQMQENGRIGGEPVGMEMAGDELPFDISELQMSEDGEEQPMMAAGGYMKSYAPGGYEPGPLRVDVPKGYEPGGGGLEVVKYEHEDGRVLFIQFMGGTPLTLIPEGFKPAATAEEEVSEGVSEQVTRDDDDSPRTPIEAPEPIDWSGEATVEDFQNYAERRGGFGQKALTVGAGMVAGLPGAGLMRIAQKMEDGRVREGLKDQIEAANQSGNTEKSAALQAILDSMDTKKDKDKDDGGKGIFGGKSSMYEDLESMDDPTKQGDFGDTWLGDLLGFDEDGFGVHGDNLTKSIGGSRRDGETSVPSATSTATPTSTPSQSSDKSSSKIGTDAGDDMTWVKMENSNALTRVRNDDPRADFANDPVYDEDE